MSDQEFMSHILGEICDYAILNEMEPDETIETISRNFLALLTISTFNEWKPKPQTNADRIRSMSDEELADVLLTHKCKECDWDGGFCGNGEIACRKEILLWLKQGVTE